MHEKREKNLEKSPWTAVNGIGQWTGRSGSVGACAAVGSGWTDQTACRRGTMLFGRASTGRTANAPTALASAAMGRDGERRGRIGVETWVDIRSGDTGRRLKLLGAGAG